MTAFDSNAIKTRISNTLQIPMERLRDEALIADIVAESFALVEMVIDLQEELDVVLDQRDIARIRTVADLTAVIRERMPA